MQPEQMNRQSSLTTTVLLQSPREYVTPLPGSPLKRLCRLFTPGRDCKEQCSHLRLPATVAFVLATGAPLPKRFVVPATCFSIVPGIESAYCLTGSSVRSEATCAVSRKSGGGQSSRELWRCTYGWIYSYSTSYPRILSMLPRICETSTTIIYLLIRKKKKNRSRSRQYVLVVIEVINYVVQMTPFGAIVNSNKI